MQPTDSTITTYQRLFVYTEELLAYYSCGKWAFGNLAKVFTTHWDDVKKAKDASDLLMRIIIKFFDPKQHASSYYSTTTQDLYRIIKRHKSGLKAKASWSRTFTFLAKSGLIAAATRYTGKVLDKSWLITAGAIAGAATAAFFLIAGTWYSREKDKSLHKNQIAQIQAWREEHLPFAPNIKPNDLQKWLEKHVAEENKPWMKGFIQG